MKMKMNVGTMKVVLVSAKGLKRRDFFGKIDPYVVLQYKDEEYVSKTAQGQGSNPKWNEEFIFRGVEYPAADDDDLQEYKLSLQIYDHDTFTNDDYLGHTIINVEGVLDVGVWKGKADLGVQKYRVVLDDATYHGEIQVGVSFMLEEWETDQRN